jgi:multimeric flavodoxin WrbA
MAALIIGFQADSSREVSMKALAVCGSPREGGNTQRLLEVACERLEEEKVQTELVLLRELEIKPCIACMRCRETRDLTCALEDDFQPVFEKILEADALIVGSPVYFGSATSQTTCLLHRVGYVAVANGRSLKGKIGAPVVVARRAGQNFTFAQLLFFFLINDMIVPGSTYWSIAFGREKGEVEADTEGMETVRHLAHNIADLLKR